MAKFSGLNAVAEDLPDGATTVDLERVSDEDADGLMGLANLLFARSLYIASQTLGWPEERAIDMVVCDWRRRLADVRR